MIEYSDSPGTCATASGFRGFMDFRVDGDEETRQLFNVWFENLLLHMLNNRCICLNAMDEAQSFPGFFLTLYLRLLAIEGCLLFIGVTILLFIYFWKGGVTEIKY